VLARDARRAHRDADPRVPGGPRRRVTRPLLLGAALAALAMVPGCADDGRELAEPLDWQTTTTRPSPPTSPPPQQVSDTGFALSSPEFEPGGPAPLDATCAGINRRPILTWQGAPPEAVELAISLSDQTDPEVPILLWLAAGIDPALSSLPAGELPPGAIETANDYGTSGWGSPCIDQLGVGTRTLQFRIHALRFPSGLTPGESGNEAWELVTGQATDSASIALTSGG
jgi:phosphatidylethanolamine-binding protein (PEBP) family uncharacterized protein